MGNNLLLVKSRHSGHQSDKSWIVVNVQQVYTPKVIAKVILHEIKVAAHSLSPSFPPPFIIQPPCIPVTVHLPQDLSRLILKPLQSRHLLFSEICVSLSSELRSYSLHRHSPKDLPTLTTTRVRRKTDVRSFKKLKDAPGLVNKLLVHCWELCGHELIQLGLVIKTQAFYLMCLCRRGIPT